MKNDCYPGEGVRQGTADGQQVVLDAHQKVSCTELDRRRRRPSFSIAQDHDSQKEALREFYESPRWIGPFRSLGATVGPLGPFALDRRHDLYGCQRIRSSR